MKLLSSSFRTGPRKDFFTQCAYEYVEFTAKGFRDYWNRWLSKGLDSFMEVQSKPSAVTSHDSWISCGCVFLTISCLGRVLLPSPTVCVAFPAATGWPLCDAGCCTSWISSLSSAELFFIFLQHFSPLKTFRQAFRIWNSLLAKESCFLVAVFAPLSSTDSLIGTSY